MKKVKAKDTPAVMKQEIKFMKKGGAPKGLIQHEQAEHAAEKKKKR